MHYIYIVECKDGTFYTGYTTNLEKRILTHNSGKGAKYTRGRIPVALKYYEEFNDKQTAMRREAEIKRLSKLKKCNLMKDFKAIIISIE